MKTKILSVCVIAGLFAGCSQLNLPKLPTPTTTTTNSQINKELIKGIKTDGKGGYYVMESEDCEKLLKAGVFVNKGYGKLSRLTDAAFSHEIDYCYHIAQDNNKADAMNISFGGEKNYHDLKAYKPYEAVK